MMRLTGRVGPESALTSTSTLSTKLEAPKDKQPPMDQTTEQRKDAACMICQQV